MTEKKEIKNESLDKAVGGQVEPQTEDVNEKVIPIADHKYTCIHCGQQVDAEYANRNGRICPNCNRNLFN